MACRWGYFEAGISAATYFNWGKKYDRLLPTEMQRLKQLEDENGKLKKLSRISASIARCCVTSHATDETVLRTVQGFNRSQDQTDADRPVRPKSAIGDAVCSKRKRRTQMTDDTQNDNDPFDRLELEAAISVDAD